MVVPGDKKEVEHLISVLEQTQRALSNGDAFALQSLSDQTIHTASIQQDTDSITIAVLLYSLNKLVTLIKKNSPKEWKTFVKKCNIELGKSVEALHNRDADEFTRHLDHAKELLESSSGKKMHTFIEAILKKASINKAGRVHEHGISLTRTAHLLGLSQWELLEYIGQRNIADSPYTATLDEKKRAMMALQFFS